MINVTCAVIRNEENEVLVVRKGEKTDHPLKWEFPGGKLARGRMIMKKLAGTPKDSGSSQPLS